MLTNHLDETQLEDIFLDTTQSLVLIIQGKLQDLRSHTNKKLDPTRKTQIL